MTTTTTGTEMTAVQVSPEIQNGVSALETWAGALVVRTPEDRTIALARVREVKAGIAGVTDFFRESKTRAHTLWKGIVAQEDAIVSKLKRVEDRVKAVVVAYDREQEAIREKERARLQAIEDERARVERQRQEQAAAAARAKEQEAARLAAEARQRAQEASNAADRAKAQAEAEKREREAAAAAAKASAKEEAAAAVVAPVVQVAEPEKAKGEATKLLWHARVVDAALIPREWMIPNDKALEAVAKSTKGAITIPGVEFYSERSLAIGK